MVVGVEVDVVVDVLAELVVAVDGLDVLGVARVDLFDVLELGRGVGVGGDAVGQAELGMGRHDHIVDREFGGVLLEIGDRRSVVLGG